tara:strand:+ start:22748 stop:25042 length:2295 start_codon:yes stop_codon:yes gene_type:complete
MIKKIKIIAVILFYNLGFSQTDYSSSWEDFFSYNNVKDFLKVDTKLYALVDNAVFIYDEFRGETNKLSSVNGLSGETATSIYYSDTFERLVIGYENGLIEIVDQNGAITIAPDISNFSLSTERAILNITEFNNKLYLSTPFAIVVYDIENLVFGDTFFIGNNSSEIRINEIAILDDKIYAATENGIYSADINNPNLIDFNNWTKSTIAGPYISIQVFDNKIYTARYRVLYELSPSLSLTTVESYPARVLKLKSSNTHLSITLRRFAYFFDTSMNQVASIVSDIDSEVYFSLNAAYALDEKIYLGTKEFGILKTTFQDISTFDEIHPDGPLSNEVFSITAERGQLWVVYGGYNLAYNILGKKLGYSHYIENNWINTQYSLDYPVKDLVSITMDPEHDNKAYISSWYDGILVVEDDQPIEIINSSNSGLEPLFGSVVLVDGTAFDRQGNFWVTNGYIDNKLKRRAPSGGWSSIDLSPIASNASGGLNELIIDKSNSVWIGSRRNGAFVYNENGDRKRALTTEPTKGSLPDPNVRTVISDKSNRIWIGTQKGMVVFYNASGLFEADIYDAEPIIILDDGIPKKLLGDQPVNTISIDGADNKWFGTDGGGALQSNPNGRETLNIFNTSNSPLPSNNILKIKVDTSNGKVYFATAKGIVAFNSNVAAFGDTLDEVYAYPNPAKRQHETITIDGRNGEHLPQGTNVKILDTAGYLVYETNVVEGQELQGGKVVWDKTNLAGTKVASGVYLVLLSNKDNTETSTTKIAIIN